MKNLEKLKRATTLVFGGITLVAFQNWSYQGAAVVKVDERDRLAHAKELLGRDSREIQNIEGVQQHILNKMTQRLPDRYKHLAPQITKTLIEESSKAQFDPVFVMAIIETESKFN